MARGKKSELGHTRAGSRRAPGRWADRELAWIKHVAEAEGVSQSALMRGRLLFDMPADWQPNEEPGQVMDTPGEAGS